VIISTFINQNLIIPVFTFGISSTSFLNAEMGDLWTSAIKIENIHEINNKPGNNFTKKNRTFDYFNFQI